MAIIASIDYRPNTGRLLVTVETDAEYSPDDLTLDAICRRAIETFTRTIVTIDTLEPTDDDGCDPETG